MYLVSWLQSATDDLAAGWLQADSATRKRITAASHEAEAQLSAEPDAHSESRPKGRRVAIFAPLTVTFRVDSNARTVTIVQVHVFGKRAK